jgi:hypothetical protein
MGMFFKYYSVPSSLGSSVPNPVVAGSSSSSVSSSSSSSSSAEPVSISSSSPSGASLKARNASCNESKSVAMYQCFAPQGSRPFVYIKLIFNQYIVSLRSVNSPFALRITAGYVRSPAEKIASAKASLASSITFRSLLFKIRRTILSTAFLSANP